MALINCPNCGKTISDKAEVCPHCGMQLLNQTSTPAPDQAPAPAPAPVQNQNPTPDPTPYPNQGTGEPYPQYPMNEPVESPKKSNKGLIIGLVAALAALLLIGGGIGAYFYMNKSDKTGTEIVQGPEGGDTVGQDTIDTPPTPPQPDKDLFVVVNGVNVRLRTSPAINNRNIIKTPSGENLHPNKGEYLEYLGEEGDFYLVRFKGYTAYISKQFSYVVER